MTLLLFLAITLPQEAESRKVDLEDTKLFFYDAFKGITFRMSKKGAVELAVKGKDGKLSKKYVAESADSFRKAYPDVVRRYGLDRYLGRPGGVTENQFNQWWEQLKKGGEFGRMPELPRARGEDWQKWMEEQRRWAEDLNRFFRRPGAAPPPAPQGREFGVKVDSVEETLRDQLSLRKDEGVIVNTVKPGSVAEKVGVKRFDVLVVLDGKPVKDKWEFRRDILDALEKPSFKLTVIRGGKRVELDVKPLGERKNK